MGPPQQWQPQPPADDPLRHWLIAAIVVSATGILGLLIWFLGIADSAPDEPTEPPTTAAPQPTDDPDPEPEPTSSEADPSTSPAEPGGGFSPDQTFVPFGPETVWLDPAYAHGVTSWETPHNPVGVSADRSILVAMSRSEGGEIAVLGLDLQTGEERWRVEGRITCRDTQPVDDYFYCALHTDDMRMPFVRIDVMTGELEEFHDHGESYGNIEILGKHGDLLIATILTTEDQLVAFTSTGEIAWQTELPERVIQCDALGEAIGCEGRGALDTYSASDGSHLFTYESDEEYASAVWGVDGFLPREDSSEASEVYTLTGELVGSVEAPMEPRFPGAMDGIFYPVAVHELAQHALTIDAEGNIVTYRDDRGGIIHNPTGTEIDGSVVAVSSDGQVLMYRDRNTGYVVHAVGGAPAPIGGETDVPRLASGVIYTTNMDVEPRIHTIYAPAEG